MAQRTTTPSSIAHLMDFMKIFRDIRRSAVIIADSIRTRERRALRASGFLKDPAPGECKDVDISDPARCPICIGNRSYHAEGYRPSSRSAIAWRTVFLTEPWEGEPVARDTISSKVSVDGMLERLLLAIRFLCNSQNDFMRPIQEVLNAFKIVQDFGIADSKRNEESLAALRAKELAVQNKEVQNACHAAYDENVASLYARHLRQQEASLYEQTER